MKRLTLYTTIDKSVWKEKFQTQGIKQTDDVGHRSNNSPLPNNNCILVQTEPFNIGTNTKDYLVKFSKPLNEIYTDYDDGLPQAVSSGILPEGEKTYEQLDTSKPFDKLYGSFVLNIEPQEIISIQHYYYNPHTGREYIDSCKSNPKRILGKHS